MSTQHPQPQGEGGSLKARLQAMTQEERNAWLLGGLAVAAAVEAELDQDDRDPLSRTRAAAASAHPSHPTPTPGRVTKSDTGDGRLSDKEGEG